MTRTLLNRSRKTTIPAFVFSLVATSVAYGNTTAMRTTGITTQPIGHHTFCKALPQECKRNRAVSPEQMTDARWAALHQINAKVNDAIVPKTDMEIWGINELWSYPETVGDCEDYVLLKRHLLQQAGFSPANLLITVVRQENGDGHAVLTVRTSEGDVVLDNLQNEIRSWRMTEYRYLKRQTPEHSGRWEDIADSRTLIASN
ncbi:MAG: transglutaminase-like cysteine peptidase [Pseudomonadota bacterium]